MSNKKSTSIAVVQHKQEVASVEQFINKAIENKVDVATMERLFALRKEVKAEIAKEAFDSSMATFQGDCPVIKKSKAGGQTNAGVVAYKYAPLDVIVSQTKELIKKNGFSYAIQTETTEKGVMVTCQVKHELGHSESSSISVPFGVKTNVMSEPQKVAAALTFAKRYAFCNAFGILTGDDDTDAQDVKGKGNARTVAGAEMTTDQKFSKALMMIQALRTKRDVMTAKKQIEDSAIYSPEQKERLIKALGNRILEIKS